MTKHIMTGGALPLPKTTFAMLSDPGHGWLILSPVWLEAVGVRLTDISTCSYQHPDGILALEEDCDAPAFLRAFEARFGRCFEVAETHQEITDIRNWPHLAHNVSAAGHPGNAGASPEDVITYEIQRCPMIEDGADGYTLFEACDHKGQTWAFIDVSVTKRVNDCLVDEIACVDNLKDIGASNAAMAAFASAYPTAAIEDHLEAVAHLTSRA